MIMKHFFNGKSNSHIPLHPHCQRRLYCWHYNLFSFHHALEQEGNLKNEKAPALLTFQYYSMECVLITVKPIMSIGMNINIQ